MGLFVGDRAALPLWWIQLVNRFITRSRLEPTVGSWTLDRWHRSVREMKATSVPNYFDTLTTFSVLLRFKKTHAGSLKNVRYMRADHESFIIKTFSRNSRVALDRSGLIYTMAYLNWIISISLDTTYYIIIYNSKIISRITINNIFSIILSRWPFENNMTP